MTLSISLGMFDVIQALAVAAIMKFLILGKRIKVDGTGFIFVCNRQ